jgi:hypothetical protein
MKKTTRLTIIGLFLVYSASFSQDFKISKVADTYPISDQSIIYALPRTGLMIHIDLIKTKITKGIYAEYAQKYLGLENVPMKDSVYWTITGVEIKPFNEPDPEHFYSLTFKTFPANIQSLLSKDNSGIILDPSAKWLQPYQASLPSEEKNEITDLRLIDKIIEERVDTLYKTILNDTSFIRVPVFKKQIIAKTNEDLIRETAHQLIKTRKIRIKLARGEFDFHPDAATLHLMFDEMQKQEEAYLSLFRGTKTEIKNAVSFTIFASNDRSNLDLCYFNAEKGISCQPIKNTDTLSLQFNKEENKLNSLQTTNYKQTSNALYYRIPNYITVSFLLGKTILFKSRIPFYQFGTVQAMSIKAK